MSFEDVAESISPEIYERFKLAIELGKWPDGRVLTKEQKEICLQTVMLYEAKNGVSERERVGFIDRTKKTSPCGPKNDKDDGEEPVRILH